MALFQKYFSVRMIIAALMVMLIAGESAFVAAGYRDKSDQLPDDQSNVATVLTVSAVVIAVGVVIYAIVHNSRKKKASAFHEKNPNPSSVGTQQSFTPPIVTAHTEPDLN